MGNQIIKCLLIANFGPRIVRSIIAYNTDSGKQPLQGDHIRAAL